MEQVENIIKTYINRYKFWCLDSSSSTSSPPQNDTGGRKGKFFIFHNYSLVSGASLPHPHSQISVVPNEVPTKTLVTQPVVNIIEQNEGFVSYCPEYSEWAYEVWIKPIFNFQFSIFNQVQISNFAKILQSSIRKLKKIHANNPHYSKKPFGYNYYIYPYSPERAERVEGWYLRIIPRFMERAGFELSTGIMVNSVDPKKAAEDLRKLL